MSTNLIKTILTLAFVQNIFAQLSALQLINGGYQSLSTSGIGQNFYQQSGNGFPAKYIIPIHTDPVNNKSRLKFIPNLSFDLGPLSGLRDDLASNTNHCPSVPQINNVHQNLPSLDISPASNQYPGYFLAHNIPIHTEAVNSKSGLKFTPKLTFNINQLDELRNFASNLNEQQLIANNPTTFQNLHLNYNSNQQICTSLPDNGFNSDSNLINAISGVPNNVFNDWDINNVEYNAQGNVNFPLNSAPRVKSLILSGEAVNNGLPFTVLPSNVPFDNIIEVPGDSGYIDGSDGLKIPRSLPNESLEKCVPGQIINGVAAFNSISNTASNNFMANMSPPGFRMNSPVPNRCMFSFPHSVQLNEALATPFDKCETCSENSLNDKATNTEPKINNNNHIALNHECQPIHTIQGEENELTLTRLPATKCSSQPAGNQFNVIDFNSLKNMLISGDLGALPIYSGLPVISVTETITVVDPEQFN